MTKLLFVDNGIEFDSILLKKRPFGGAEVAFVSLVEALAKLNYEVLVYNNCLNEGRINGVKWRKLDSRIFEEKFDVLIVNRGDKFLNFKKECKKRIFWIHNPAKYLLKYRYLTKLFFNKFKIVFSSNFHLSTYPWWAPASEKFIIPYGVNNETILQREKAPKPISIFTSNPMRGLSWLLDQWEKNIFPNVKKARLNLFTGLETYGKFGLKHEKSINKILSRVQNVKINGIHLSPPISRNELKKQISKSRVLLYKGTNDETFCMAVAEAQVLGIPAVVCNFGSLKERIKNNQTGYVCENDEDFSLKTIKLLKDDKTWMRMHKNLIKNNNHENWMEIGKRWKKIID